MWITTYHRFSNRAAFIRACMAAGWRCHTNQDPELPRGIAMELLGPLIGGPRAGPDGELEQGEVLDDRYHVKLAWHEQAPHRAFMHSQCAPPTPWRTWGEFPTCTAADSTVKQSRGGNMPIQKPLADRAYTARRMQA
jgi:hypothetical protein